MIEDDYLSELQLKGRAAPALASLDRARARHSHRVFQQDPQPDPAPGFSRRSPALAARFAEVAACSRAGAWALGAARDRGVHARRPLFAASAAHEARLCGAARRLAEMSSAARRASITIAGLAVLLRLPDGAPDLAIARETLSFGLAPAPLSLWYASPASARSGLLLGVATAPQKRLAASCDRLFGIIDRLV